MSKRKYHTEPGFITIPEANELVVRILGIQNKTDGKSYYHTILNGAKKGLYGGRRYKTRMYQVRKKDIIQFQKRVFLLSQ